MTTTETRLKIAKAKPAPQEILPAARRTFFWDGSPFGDLAFRPLFAPFFSGTGFTPARLHFQCHFLVEEPDHVRPADRVHHHWHVEAGFSVLVIAFGVFMVFDI